MSETIRDHKDLIVWQRAMRLTKEVYTLSGAFPGEERFGLTAQVRRAVVSVPSNIAEGHARQGREFYHFLSIALGSLAEVETQLIIAVELGYLEQDAIKAAEGYIAEIRRMSYAIGRKLLNQNAPREASPS